MIINVCCDVRDCEEIKEMEFNGSNNINWKCDNHNKESEKGGKKW